MATVYADPHVASSEYLAHERRLEQCLRALQTRGWEQRLQPLATHMIERRLVRACGDTGAPLRHLDVEVLRAALSQMLRHEWEDASIIYELVVEGADPGLVAAERGISRLMLTELLRDAVDALAAQYEDVAYASVGQTKQEQVQARLAGKRS